MEVDGRLLMQDLKGRRLGERGEIISGQQIQEPRVFGNKRTGEEGRYLFIESRREMM